MLLEVRLITGEPNGVRLPEILKGSWIAISFLAWSRGLDGGGWGAINRTKYYSPIALTNTGKIAANYGSTQFVELVL